MGESTAISWTDHTFNGWWGCNRVSPGCENCYAETFDKRVGGDHWGPGKLRRVFSDKHWQEPLKWDARAAKDGVTRKMFCFSMADIFDDEAPEGQRERFFDLCRNTPHLIKQLLTKRADGYERLLPDDLMHDPLVWKGITAENQEWFDKRWPHLEGLPGVRWVSYEPALGPMEPSDRLTYERMPDCGKLEGRKARTPRRSRVQAVEVGCVQEGRISLSKMRQQGSPTRSSRKSVFEISGIAARP